MNQINKALALAKKAHKEQVDKSGKPYIEHPIAVASKVKTDDEKTVALLHDVVEDTPITIEYIYSEFGNTIGDAVKALTHLKEHPYEDYLRNVKKNKLAFKVKLADINHNLDLNRLGKITEKDKKRVIKYIDALKILLDL